MIRIAVSQCKLRLTLPYREEVLRRVMGVKFSDAGPGGKLFGIVVMCVGAR